MTHSEAFQITYCTSSWCADDGDRGKAVLCTAALARRPRVQLLHVQLSEVGGAGKEHGQSSGQEAASKYGSTVAWCRDVQQLLGALSGVTVLRIEDDCVAVRLLTSFHTTWEALGACAAAPTAMPAPNQDHDVNIAACHGAF